MKFRKSGSSPVRRNCCRSDRIVGGSDYGQHGSKYSSNSISSKYSNDSATNAPKLYDSDGNYRGKLSTNKYDPDSVSNPYGHQQSQV